VCDVGYQFLVDRYGQIFEGRAGGADRPVIGAQAGGFNTDSFGVSAIGDFTSATPPSGMLSQISRVLGWKLGLHGRDPQGRTQLSSAGGDATQHPAGTVVPLNVVSGHHDVDLTSCPIGLYDYLPSMREQAAQYAAANSYRSEDLYGILPAQTATGRVEVHAQSASSSYPRRLVDAAPALGQGSLGDWRFFVGSSVSDTRPGPHRRTPARRRVGAGRGPRRELGELLPRLHDPRRDAAGPAGSRQHNPGRRGWAPSVATCTSSPTAQRGPGASSACRLQLQLLHAVPYARARRSAGTSRPPTRASWWPRAPKTSTPSCTARIPDRAAPRACLPDPWV
jgi:N-acetylmuramoyl-L-alanine amidase